jgi:hypothetical protein
MILELSDGGMAQIDEEDFTVVKGFDWYLTKHHHGKTPYVYCRADKSKGIKAQALHRLIMKAERGQLVDHVNRDGTDCRKQNLRICSQQQNSANHGRISSGASGFIGVRKRGAGWQAYLVHKRDTTIIGVFPTAEMAARMRDICAKRFWGEFATLNFPE